MNSHAMQAVNYSNMAIGTAGAVHGRSPGNKDAQDLANAIRQVARAVQELAKAVK